MKMQHSTFTGIKQGLPLSPMLFLFYITDIHDYFNTFFNLNNCILEKMHILVHAEDLTLVTISRSELIKKLEILLKYCKLNKIVIEHSKCKFIVINGTDEDKDSIPFDSKTLVSCEQLDILGGFISDNLEQDLKKHIKNRYKNVIKYYNWLKNHRYAPLMVKLKIIEACVMSNVLYGCETFGRNIPEELEKLYLKMIKAALGTRSNTPNSIVLIESGMLPLKALILSRQLNFFKKFKASLKPDLARAFVLNAMLTEPSSFLNHYTTLEDKYESSKQIFEESITEVKNTILRKNDPENYKYL